MRAKVHGVEWAYLGPLTYRDVWIEAGDNDLIIEPSQPAAEHTSALPECVRDMLPALPPVSERWS